MPKHAALLEKMEIIRAIFEQSSLNGYEGPENPELVIVCGGSGTPCSRDALEILGLQQKVAILKIGTLWPFPSKRVAELAGRVKPYVVRVLNGVRVGQGTFAVIAGPCSVESEEQVEACAALVSRSGLRLLRGGAFKPRSSPYAFQGLGEQGLRILADAVRRHGLAVVTEILSEHDVDLVSRYADVFQVGARNMQNYALLRALGESGRPVLLKRSMMGTIEELLLSAEYLMKGGNAKVMLCERGIRTFETHTRNTLDIAAVPAIKRLSHLPILVDPSHAVGDWHYVAPASLAALAAGADGLLVEIHPEPALAKSDGKQTLTFPRFEALLGRLRAIAPHLGVEVV